MSLPACAEIVAKGDPDRFRAVMTLPLAAREVLLPLYAFNVEVARAPWVTEEPMIAEMRLQWWRDVLDEIVGGGAVRRHEVVDALTPVLRDKAVPVDALLGIIDARRWDAARAPFSDFAALQDYCAQTGGGLMWATARALGSTDELRARALGQASGGANLFLGFAQIEAKGRQVLAEPSDDAVADLARHWLDLLTSPDAAGSKDRALTHAARAAWRMRPVLRQALRDPAAVHAGRLGPGGFGRQTALWRAMLLGY